MNYDVVIFGGQGVIGRELLRHLCRVGLKVLLVGNNKYLSPHEVGYPHDFLKFCDFDSLEIRRMSYRTRWVVHLLHVRSDSVSIGQYDEPARNVEQLIRIIELSTMLEAERILYASSGGTVYGEHGVRALSEDDPKFPITAYGVTKLICEDMLLDQSTRLDASVVIVRPGNAYSSWRSRSSLGFLNSAVEAITLGRPLHIFGNDTVRDYVHATDVAAACVALLESNSDARIFNIGSGVGTGTDAIINLINKIGSGFSLSPLIEIRCPRRNIDVQNNILSYSRLHMATGWHPEINILDGLRLLFEDAMQNRNTNK